MSSDVAKVITFSRRMEVSMCKNTRKSSIIIFTIFLCSVLMFSCERDKSPLSTWDAFYPASSTTLEKKPNIYLYPMDNMKLDVKVVFPTGGKIVESIPEHKSGWHVQVEKSGLIDGKYRFLYYESKTLDLYQYEKGWIVPQNSLKNFFEEKMAQYGFIEPEIKDFVDYWIPLLTTHGFYAIYPQEEDIINKMIRLEFSQNPDSLFRLFFGIKGTNIPNLELKEPKIEKFERKGFSVVEWGVI